MRRWHEDYSRTRREWKKHYLIHVENNVGFARVPGKDPYEIDCVCDVQQGRFRKTRAFGGGKPRSPFYHAEKYPRRERTRQELLAGLRLREGLLDVGLWG